MHAIRELIDARKTAMREAANMMRSGEVRLMQTTLTAWRDAHFADKVGKLDKLQGFFLSREVPRLWSTPRPGRPSCLLCILAVSDALTAACPPPLCQRLAGVVASARGAHVAAHDTQRAAGETAV
eukprot:2424994-Prymnesium_polylepis.1